MLSVKDYLSAILAIDFFCHVSAAKISKPDTLSVFYREMAHVFDNSDIFAVLNMTKKFNS